MLVADTTFLIDWAVGEAGAMQAAQAADDNGEILATTFVNAYEFLLGNVRRKGAAREGAIRMVQRLLILDGDTQSALRSVEAASATMAKGESVATVDLLVAGIVLREGAILLTRNSDFARVPGLITKSY